jgi:hypothetical protein
MNAEQDSDKVKETKVDEAREQNPVPLLVKPRADFNEEQVELYASEFVCW